ncbi:MAG: response regulator [Desulfuromonadaceae bacterium]|nr:response regulator [Desulfuromonadaceae bacterium]
MSPYTQWSHFRTSFQFKLFFIFTLLTFLIACLLCSMYIISERQSYHHEASEQLQLRALRLADAVRIPLYADDREMLKMIAKEMVTTPEIRTVSVSSADGTVLVEVHSTNHSPDPPESSETIEQSAEVRGDPFMDSLEAALTGTNNKTTTDLLGTVRIERSTEDLSLAVRKAVIISVSAAIVFWLSVSGCSYLVLRKLTRSFNVLMNGIQTMQDGNFTSRIEIDSDDEPSRAAQAINKLANALQERNEDNTRLQTERLDFERQMFQAQKLESLGVMASGIAHDFNNLLQSIQGNIELAALNLDRNSAAQQYISQAMNSASRAALLAGMMLTYVGKGTVTKKPLNLNTMVRENADMLRTAASSAVRMELHLSTDLPIILADEAHIQQVVMNLISNAAESIVEQPGIVSISTGVQDYDPDYLAGSVLEDKPDAGRFIFVEVSDNGCGMSEETQKRLFDPFFTTKFTGRGLGMSAVMGIMRTHNGALFVKSESGCGTTFRALFPAPELAPEDVLQVPDALTSPEPTGISEKPLSGMVLVVDDEKSVLRVCTKMVALCGFTVIAACDGIDAVTKFREHADQIAVVLLDLTMPNMDGLIAMREIRGIRPDCRVILASGFNEEEMSSRMDAHTPSGFIRKPYNMKELKAELSRVMMSS